MPAVSDLSGTLFPKGPFAIHEPGPTQADGCPGGPDMVLVPGLCFDNRGWALGHRIGFYDRYLWPGANVRLGLGCRRKSPRKINFDPQISLGRVVSRKRILGLLRPRADACRPGEVLMKHTRPGRRNYFEGESFGADLRRQTGLGGEVSSTPP